MSSHRWFFVSGVRPYRRTVDATAKPLARYSAIEGALASGFAAADLTTSRDETIVGAVPNTSGPPSPSRRDWSIIVNRLPFSAIVQKNGRKGASDNFELLRMTATWKQFYLRAFLRYGA